MRATMLLALGTVWIAAGCGSGGSRPSDTQAFGAGGAMTTTAEPAAPTATRQFRAAGPALPELRVAVRNALRADCRVVYDDGIRGYVPPTAGHLRANLAVDNVVPCELTREEAVKFALELATANFNVSPSELRLERVSSVRRGSSPIYDGWHVTFGQVYHGASLYNVDNDSWAASFSNTMGGVRVSVFAGDDYDLCAYPWDVTEIRGTGGATLEESQAKDLARQALQIEDSQPHHFVQCRLAYAPKVEAARTTDGELIPVWMVSIALDLDLSKIKSYCLAYKGGCAVLDARTGRLLSGGTPAGLPEELEEEAARLTDWSGEASNIRGTLEQLKIGMSAAEVAAILRPSTLGEVTWYRGDQSPVEHVFHLAGGRELHVKFGGSFEGSMRGRVVELGPVQTKRRWRHGFWHPDSKDAKAAVAIAVADWKRRIQEGGVPSAEQPVNPGGRQVYDEQPASRVDLPMPDGGTISCTLNASGEYHSHRMVVLDVMSGDRWISQIMVDMEDKVVVPIQWTPTAADLARARSIADPSVASFVGSPRSDANAVEVTGWGLYDYGPTRRLLNLSYMKNEPDGSQSIWGVTVDMDAGKIDE